MATSPLLGFGNPYSDQMTTLLGLDPAEMRRQALWRGLQQAGIGLMTGGTVGDAFKGFSEGADEAKSQYTEQAMLGYKMKEAEQDRAYQEQERAAKEAEREQFNSYISTLPPDLQPAIRANPGLMDDYVKATNPAFQKAASGDQHFGTPIPYDMGGGQIGYGLPTKTGGFTPLQAPGEGGFLSPYDKSFQAKQGMVEGQGEGERKINAPKVMARSQELDMQWQLVDDKLDGSIAQIEGGSFQAGFIGSLASAVPGTPQHDLAEDLKTIAANIGFDKLQSMREASPTGGALGQVSDFENRLLQAIRGSLQQSQSAPQLASNLRRIKQDLALLKAYKDQAVMRDFGDVLGMPAPQAGGAPAAPNGAPVRRKYNPATGTLE